jgi:phosphoribosyl 1,2-cyclic phosphodiesterase/CheY-like chemotaxis protein
MKKILVIEDDEALNEYAVRALKKADYEVERAYDGQEGIEKALAFKPDCVVVDLMMPGMHGIEVCERLRREETTANVRILVASAKGYQQDVDAATHAGADAYLRKPYRTEALQEKVAELLAAELPVRNGRRRRGEDEHPARAPKADAAIDSDSGQSQDVKVRFWGTRGSCPAPGPDTVRYGGNTACTELRFGNLICVIDCGTGVRELGIDLLKEYRDKDKPIEAHVFVGHTHWDHIQGFPFFTPFYIPRNRFSLYSVRGAGKSLERVFRGQMASDYFPVPLKSLSADIQFVEMEAPVQLGPVKISYQFLNHPGIAIGFRFDAFGKSVTYISDHETFRRLNGDSEVTRKQDDKIAEFAKGSDLFICEAQYDEEEYKYKKGWGHSTFMDVLELGMKAEAEHLVLFHHDPTHTDEMMDEYLDNCREYVRKAGSSMILTAARERQTIDV